MRRLRPAAGLCHVGYGVHAALRAVECLSLCLRRIGDEARAQRAAAMF